MEINEIESFSLLARSDVHEQKFQYMLDNLKTLNGYEVNKFTASYTRPLLQNAKTVELCVPFEVKAQMNRNARRPSPIKKPESQKTTIIEIKSNPGHIPTESDIATQREDTLATTLPTEPDDLSKRSPSKRTALREERGFTCPPGEWSNDHSLIQNDSLPLRNEESNPSGLVHRPSLRKPPMTHLLRKQNTKVVNEQPQSLSPIASNQSRKQFRKVSFMEPGISGRSSILRSLIIPDKIEEKAEEPGRLSQRKPSTQRRQNHRSQTTNSNLSRNSLLLKMLDNRHSNPLDQLQLDNFHSLTERSRFPSKDGSKSETVSKIESRTVVLSSRIRQDDIEDNVKEREKFVREFIDENFGGCTQQGRYIQSMSNQQSMMNYQKAHSIQPNQIIKNFEKLVTDESLLNSFQSRFSYMDVALINANGEGDQLKEVYMKQRTKDRAFQRQAWRERFGVISSLEADFAKLKRDARSNNLSVDIEAPKLKTGDQNPVRLFQRPIKRKTRGQVAQEVQKNLHRTYNKIVELTSARQFRGKKLMPNRLEIMQPIRTYQG